MLHLRHFIERVLPLTLTQLMTYIWTQQVHGMLPYGIITFCFILALCLLAAGDARPGAGVVAEQQAVAPAGEGEKGGCSVLGNLQGIVVL